MGESVDSALARVRALLRRSILLRAAWMPGLEDGPAARALTAFIMGRPNEGEVDAAEDLAELEEELGPIGGRTPDEDSVASRFARIRDRLGLSPLTCDAVWLLLAPELDSRFLAAYRLTWADGRQRYCDEDFLRTTLAPRGHAYLPGLLDASCDVVRLRLVERLEVPGAAAPRFRPSRRFLDFLAGVDAVDARVSNRVHVSAGAPPAAWEGFDLGAPFGDALELRGVAVVEAPRRANLGVALRQRAGARGEAVVTLDLAELAGSGAAMAEAAPSDAPHPLVAEDAELLRAALREAHFADGVLHVRGVETLHAVGAADARRVGEVLAREVIPVVLESAGPLPSVVLTHMVPSQRVTVRAAKGPSGAQLRAMWSQLLSRGGAATADAVAEGTIDELATIPCDAVTMEMACALHRETGAPLATLARQLSMQALPTLAKRVEVNLGWEDVVLPPQVADQLAQVRAFVAHYDKVMTTWGLGAKASGRGVKVLFSGASGTGKTLTSGLLARESLRELYQVDVSMVMSKWVGETEKHLGRLFAEATESGAALLFDEADALFRTRSGGSSAGDRFGGQVVNFLLETIESFDGMVILTTNHESAIDTAFARRLSYHVHFTPPDAEQRVRLWEVHLPADLPLADEVDLRWLSEAFELTGGEIRKASIRAAVNTLERGGACVDLGDLEDAVVSLYVEKGRLPPARR